MSQSPNQLSKRKRVPGVDTANIIEGSESRRAKRRKDGSPMKVSESASSAAGDASVDIEGDGGEEGGMGGLKAAGTEGSRQSAVELGIKLFETLKNAKNTSGIKLAADFMELPKKRDYPDYYVQIKQPIAFDDIRARLDKKSYASFDDVMADFDLCFRNAKRYNIKGSDIWNAARDLQRIATATYKALRPDMPENEEDVYEDDEDEDEEGASSKKDGKDGAKRKAGRPSALQGKYLARLDQLVKKTDSEGNLYSAVFMDEVSRKEYPGYFKVIKKPIAFKTIYKRVKNKEYSTPKAFMDDVELVFTNATTFNEDHSQIWEDAKVLQATFHALCADWRAEYADTSASGSAVPKLKLKVPPAKPDPVTVRLPHLGSAPPTSVATPQPQRAQSGAAGTPAHSRTPLQTASTPSSSVLAQPTPSYARPTPPVLPAHLQASTPAQSSRSPSVQVPHPPMITGVELVTYPAGRRIMVEQDKVTTLCSWALRLGLNETSIALTVQLASESGSTPAPAPNGITANGNTSGTGEAPDLVEIKCNATALIPKAISVESGAKKARWDAPLVIGTNIVEVRVKGTGRPGNVWRIAVDRTM